MKRGREGREGRGREGGEEGGEGGEGKRGRGGRNGRRGKEGREVIPLHIDSVTHTHSCKQTPTRVNTQTQTCTLIHDHVQA